MFQTINQPCIELLSFEAWIPKNRPPGAASLASPEKNTTESSRLRDAASTKGVGKIDDLELICENNRCHKMLFDDLMVIYKML